jgi:hypothetical protein
MLRRLKDQPHATWTAEKAALFGCRPEHLTGPAGLLSEECKIQWSVHPIGGSRADGDPARDRELARGR